MNKCNLYVNELRDYIDFIKQAMKVNLEPCL